MASRFLVPFLVSVACLAACGSRTDLVTTEDGGVVSPVEAATEDAGSTPPSSVADGTVQNACGPTDGPALTLIFTTTPLACMDTPTADYDEIDLYSKLTGPGTTSFTPSGVNGAGIASSCAGLVCVQATHVTLDVTEYVPGAATAAGVYTLELTDGRTVSQTFVITQCNIATFCG